MTDDELSTTSSLPTTLSESLSFTARPFEPLPRQQQSAFNGAVFVTSEQRESWPCLHRGSTNTLMVRPESRVVGSQHRRVQNQRKK
ncbi:hypothetical protein KOW79_022210 [Hemibagrus wyckioides]|uniref:Uncharacterized protein n=1 Tax=Hemibagrus wyckioides TaxID=337641 RepID=A0A9D3N316_9TELE|nr:hypothetical protein KOW79_022210 [Hemibagrus wyckioides]